MTQTITMQPYPAYKPSNIEWIGEIPSHWVMKKLKYVGVLKSGDSITSEEIDENYTYPVFGGNGFRGFCEKNNYDGNYVLIGRQGALCGNINYAKGQFWASEHAVVVSIIGKDETIWLGELLREMNLNQYSQSAAQPGLAVDKIKNLPIPVPPLPEQQAIVKYLDQKTTLIDELIAKKTQHIALLQEQRTALINHAVTKGLNDEVEMKDSGIEWIGEIPEHWEVKKLSYVAKINSGATPDRSNPNYWDGEIPWIKTGEVDYNIIYSAEEYITDEGYKNSSTKLAPTGTLLMAMYGQGVTRGRVALLGVPATYNQACCAILFSEYVNNKFGFFFFKMAYEYIRDDGNETSQMNISTGYISSLKILVPPIPEQQAIVAYLDEQTALIDKIIAVETQYIASLKEYRQSLISAVVTGKICVLD